MTTSLCSENLKNAANSLFPSAEVCQTLKAEYGISIIPAAEPNKYLVTRAPAPGRPPFRFLISKEIGHLIGPMVGLLDANAAKGILEHHIRLEVTRCYQKHGDAEWKARVQRYINVDPMRAVLEVAIYDSCTFESLWTRIKHLGK